MVALNVLHTNILFLHFSSVGRTRIRPDVFSVVASGLGVVISMDLEPVKDRQTSPE